MNWLAPNTDHTTDFDVLSDETANGQVSLFAFPSREN